MFENGGEKNRGAFTEQAKIACAGFVIWFRIMYLLGEDYRRKHEYFAPVGAPKALLVFLSWGRADIEYGQVQSCDIHKYVEVLR